jgi:hypothetical protein
MKQSFPRGKQRHGKRYPATVWHPTSHLLHQVAQELVPSCSNQTLVLDAFSTKEEDFKTSEGWYLKA